MTQQFRPANATPSLLRILQRFDTMVTGILSTDVGHLVLAVLGEDSLGGKCLRELGLTEDRILADSVADAAPSVVLDAALEPRDVRDIGDLTWLRKILDRAQSIARSNGELEFSSHHFVQGMIRSEGPVKKQLLEFGVTPEDVDALLGQETKSCQPLSVEFQLQAELLSPDGRSHDGSATEIFEPVVGRATDENLLANRECESLFGSTNQYQGTDVPRSPMNSFPAVRTLIDANLNRAREGLRVLEDYSRFIVRDAATSASLKQMRHDLVHAEKLLIRDVGSSLVSRDVAADVGTQVTTSEEQRRSDVDDIVAANSRRVQEALRSLEEFGKLLCVEFAGRIKQLRYRSYAQEQQLRCHRVVPTEDEDLQAEKQTRLQRLHTAHLYVLVTEKACKLPWKTAVAGALEGGADVIQLREKELAESELIARGRWIRDACCEAGALFIFNDRANLVAESGADGVHLGQEDDGPVSVRTFLDRSRLLGVSTHNEAEILAANGAVDYLGVGPVFTSNTKQFAFFPGTQFVETAARTALCPWFAIGGITLRNVDLVLRCGATRVAVSNAVIGTDNPITAARELRDAVTAEEGNKPESLPFRQGH